MMLAALLLAAVGWAAAAGPGSGEVDVSEWLSSKGLGQVAGIATDSKGLVHVFHRGERVYDGDSFDERGNFLQRAQGPIRQNVHIVLDPVSGEVVHEGGAGQFFMPHGLSIDAEDNVWLTDIALHQVFKLSGGSHVPSLVLGTAWLHGNTTATFCKPTDVAVSKDGFIFVSDGYCNHRVVKFDPAGEYMGQFGAHREEGEVGGFEVPHSVALVEAEGWNLVCVADREKERVQCFSAGLERSTGPALPLGTFIRQATHLGRVFAIRTTGTYMIGVTNGRSGLDGSFDAEERVLFVVNLRDGESGTHDVGLLNPHCLAVANDDSVYVGEIGPNRVLRVNL